MTKMQSSWAKVGWIGLALLLFALGYLLLNFRILVVGVLYRWAAHDQFNAIWNLLAYAVQGALLFLVIGTASGWAIRLVLLFVFVSGVVNLVYQNILGGLIDLSTFQWMLAESRQFLSAFKEFYREFAWGVAKAGAALGFFVLTRHAIQRSGWWQSAHARAGGRALTLALLVAFLAVDPALKAFGRDRGAEMNAYGMAYRSMTEAIPERDPVAVEPVAMPSVSKILWLVDESIAWRHYDEMLRPQWVARWGGVDFGEARSLGNCSAQSNAALRWGVNVEQLSASTDLRKNSTIWAYAKKAGFRTVLLDGQVYGNPQNYLWSPEKSLIDEVASMAAGLDTDRKLALRLNGLLKSEGREFVYAVLKGMHYQYYSNYPDGEQDRNLPVQEQYRKALQYSKGEFLDTLLDGVDMRGVAIVYTSDHGQNLGAGVIPHCNSEPHPDELSVPLVLFAGADLRESLLAEGGWDPISQPDIPHHASVDGLRAKPRRAGLRQPVARHAQANGPLRQAHLPQWRVRIDRVLCGRSQLRRLGPRCSDVGNIK